MTRTFESPWVRPAGRRLNGAQLTRRALAAASLAALTIAPAAVQAQETGVGRAVVTVETKHSEAAPVVPQQSVTLLENGKPAEIQDWVPLREDRAGLQLAILIDDSARNGLSLQLNDVRKFIMGLPPTTQVAVGYMRNGQPNLARPFTADHAAAARALRIPSGVPGSNASPYFCLSDLIRHWPNPDPALRREVLMVTDGVDRYFGARYDPENPYVQAAISDAQRAGVLVYSIYYSDRGDPGRFASEGGQNYLLQVAQSTGGQSYFQGSGNAVSFQPYLADLQRRLQNQYELDFRARPSRDLQRIKVKTSEPNTRLTAPARVAIRATPAQP